MQLTPKNLRRWAKREGYEPRWMVGAHTLRDFIADNTFKCRVCDRRFTDERDMLCDDDGIPEDASLCEQCGQEAPSFFPVARWIVEHA